MFFVSEKLNVRDIELKTKINKKSCHTKLSFSFLRIIHIILRGLEINLIETIKNIALIISIE